MSKEQNQKKCDMCGGRGKIIKNWDAFDKINPYQAIGFDKREEERRMNLTKKHLEYVQNVEDLAKLIYNNPIKRPSFSDFFIYQE